MARRHKLWAAATRKRMIIILGEHCAACGATDHLTFDCCEPMGDSHHRKSAPERITFYRKQMRAGNVQLLCNECNSLKGDIGFKEWLSACAHADSGNMEMRLARYPGRGPERLWADRRQMIRKYLIDNSPNWAYRRRG
jgi:hypothetical protein